MIKWNEYLNITLWKLYDIIEILTCWEGSTKECSPNGSMLTNIIIHSEQSELVLLKVLKILNDNEIDIEDLSAVPTNLEDIFLNMVRENASNN